VPLFEVGDGGVFVLLEGITTRLAAVPVGTEQVLIAVEAPAERFPQLEAKAGPFLSTIAFAP
jgi:hypothetical protein